MKLQAQITKVCRPGWGWRGEGGARPRAELKLEVVKGRAKVVI